MMAHRLVTLIPCRALSLVGPVCAPQTLKNVTYFLESAFNPVTLGAQPAFKAQYKEAGAVQRLLDDMLALAQSACPSLPRAATSTISSFDAFKAYGEDDDEEDDDDEEEAARREAQRESSARKASLLLQEHNGEILVYRNGAPFVASLAVAIGREAALAALQQQGAWQQQQQQQQGTRSRRERGRSASSAPLAAGTPPQSLAAVSAQSLAAVSALATRRAFLKAWVGLGGPGSFLAHMAAAARESPSSPGSAAPSASPGGMSSSQQVVYRQRVWERLALLTAVRPWFSELFTRFIGGAEGAGKGKRAAKRARRDAPLLEAAEKLQRHLLADAQQQAARGVLEAPLRQAVQALQRMGSKLGLWASGGRTGRHRAKDETLQNVARVLSKQLISECAM